MIMFIRGRYREIYFTYDNHCYGPTGDSKRAQERPCKECDNEGKIDWWVLWKDPA